MSRCQCVLTDATGERFDRCAATTSGPDDPMCESCRRHGHDVSPLQLSLTDPRRRLFT